MLSGIIGISACGNKTDNNSSQTDSIQADSLQADSLQTDSADMQQLQETTDEPAADAKAKSIQAGGTAVTVGAPLAETLKKAKGVRFEYNADFGVDAVIGKVMIRIPDEDITKEGQDFVNAIPSDIEPNLDFKISYIKSSAKIRDFEKCD